MARAIHLLGPDHEKPFACLNCAHLPPQALESLLFGTGQGAPLAGLYLQNIAALPRDLQERLQARLEAEGEVSPRFCAGVMDDPQEAVRLGKLVEGLYCRLSTLSIELPTLKERMEDFDAWADHFLARATAPATGKCRA